MKWKSPFPFSEKWEAESVLGPGYSRRKMLNINLRKAICDFHSNLPATIGTKYCSVANSDNKRRIRRSQLSDKTSMAKVACIKLQLKHIHGRWACIRCFVVEEINVSNSTPWSVSLLVTSWFHHNFSESTSLIIFCCSFYFYCATAGLVSQGGTRILIQTLK